MITLTLYCLTKWWYYNIMRFFQVDNTNSLAGTPCCWEPEKNLMRYHNIIILLGVKGQAIYVLMEICLQWSKWLGPVSSTYSSCSALMLHFRNFQLLLMTILAHMTWDLDDSRLVEGVKWCFLFVSAYQKT